MLLSGGAGMHDTGQVCPGPQVWHTSPSATWAHLCVGLRPQVPMSICIGWKEHRTRSPEAHLLDLTIPLTVERPWALDLPPPGSQLPTQDISRAPSSLGSNASGHHTSIHTFSPRMSPAASP